MITNLLEREPQLEMLQNALDKARQGRGAVVLVSAEAGGGKTSLVTEFAAPYRSAGRVLWGACDPLFTPRPLGPLYDIAVQDLPGLLEPLTAGANWLAVALALQKAVLGFPEALVVFEDIHWADEATLDLLKYLGRRIGQTRVLLILTYREDEVSSRRSLQETLGSFPAGQTLRLALQPLSEPAVARLAQEASRPAAGIYQATRGNPFFVTEVLRSQGEQIPQTVRAAVLSRAAHLPAPARDVLELLSLIPGAARLELVEEILHPDPAVIDACIDGGFLVQSGNSLSFRHELARLALSESIAVNRSKELHRRVLQFLQSQMDAAPLARLVHHAVGAADEKRVLEYAPQAAQEASYHGAHREAARHFQTALSYSWLLDADERARLSDALAFEYYLTGQMDRAIRLRQEALQAWRQSGQTARIGDDLRWLSRLSWFQGRKQEADQFANQAIDLLQTLPPGPELAMAYSNRSQLHMLTEQTEAAVAWGSRALKLAETLHDDEILIHALTNIGTAEILSGDRSGLIKLEQALALALVKELHDHVARCYANISSFAVMQRDYPLAEDVLRQGIAYTTDRDMDSYSIYLRGWQARLQFEKGAWAEALQGAEEVLSANPGSTVMALPAATVLAAVKMRRGDPDAARYLDQARDMAWPTGELQRMGPVAAARAESAWWSGARETVLAETAAALELALQARDAWQLGQILYWIWRAGGEAALDRQIPLGYRAMIAGDWQTAAAEWARIGCPYERALALSAGDPAAKIQALQIFELLGARPAARALQEQVRREGVKGLPRGPRPATRANPAGLTAREMDILALLVEGLSNAEISARLSIAMKTVDHHVSSILAKLGVRSRLEAAAAARQKKIMLPAK